jgi:pimeloyl-ACP methyl ester carboxylesterase
MFLTLTVIFLPLFVTLIIIGALYLFKPSILVNGFIKSGPKMLPLVVGRFVKKFITVDDMNISYIERESTGDNQPTVVFVHGLTAFKYVWIPIIRMLPYTWRIIAIDLPGHGESGFNDESVYHSKEMAKTLHKILVKINVEKIHIVSESLGSLYGSKFIENNPDMIQSMTMLGPAFIHKVKGGQLTPVICLGEKDHFDPNNNALKDFLPPDADGFRKLIELSFHNSSFKALLHDKFLKAIIAVHQQNYPNYERIMHDIREARGTGVEIAKNLTIYSKIPLLVIWGKHDKICHISGADLIKQHVPNAQVVLVESGHAASIEVAGECAKLINHFINSNHPTDNADKTSHC